MLIFCCLETACFRFAPSSSLKSSSCCSSDPQSSAVNQRNKTCQQVLTRLLSLYLLSSLTSAHLPPKQLLNSRAASISVISSDNELLLRSLGKPQDLCFHYGWEWWTVLVKVCFKKTILCLWVLLVVLGCLSSY